MAKTTRKKNQTAGILNFGSTKGMIIGGVIVLVCLSASILTMCKGLGDSDGKINSTGGHCGNYIFFSK